MNIALKLVYKGHVQGVGFRWTTDRIAASYEVCGYVRNLPDGTVELVVEGKEDIVKNFLNHLENEMTNYIVTSSKEAMVLNGYSDFAIRR